MAGDEPAWSDLRASARRLGALAWTEQRLSTLLAALVADIEDPDTCLLAASLGRRCADRAEVVSARLPELREFPADDLVRPSGPAWQAAVEGVGDGPVSAVLAGLGRSVLPRLAEAYRVVADSASPVAEPSVRRHLGLLVGQVAADAGLAREAATAASEPPGLVGLLSSADAEGGAVGR